MINTYHYSAHFAGRICEDCFEHFSNVNVSLYRSTENECPDQVSIKNAFRQLSDGELKKMESSLLAEGVTDDSGKVEITIDPGKPGYQGECIEVVITFNRIVGNNQELKQPEHFRIAYYTPQWNPTENYYAHFSDFYVPASIWCAYLEQHGVWVICGYVNTCDKPVSPVDNVTVKAYDVDWVQDDFLGSATTDSSGQFKIYYDVSKFNRTPFSPFINIEWTGGPDVYFKIEGVDSGGSLVTLLDESPSRGRQPDRENVPNCFCTRLCVQKEKSPTGTTFIDSAWTGIGTHFTIPGSTLNDFNADGYAGSLKYAFTRTIRMTGQSLRFSNGNPIEYRFLVSHTVADNGTPSLPAGNFSDIVGVGAGLNLFVNTRIGQMIRVADSDPENIYAKTEDLDSEGWLDVNKSITRTFTDNPLRDPL
ncbi:MAG TPA: hypothetical protein ENI64_07320, partial [Gammaproteobacteria bacterium]|nr:hypothetical protein [Gammaproteobacteria bacterium]